MSNRYRGNTRPQGLPPEIQTIVSKIQKIKTWSEYDINEIAKINGDANKIAEKIANIDGKPQSSQMRKFYDEVIRAEMAISGINKDYEKAKTIIAMFGPRLAVRKNRGHIGNIFYEVMNNATELSKFGKTNEEFMKNLDKFLKFFEAIVGYYALYKR